MGREEADLGAGELMAACRLNKQENEVAEAPEDLPEESGGEDLTKEKEEEENEDVSSRGSRRGD